MARTEDDGELFYKPGHLVEFAARGVDVDVDVDVAWSGGGRKMVTGSSFAAPRWTGLLAYLLSLNPGITPLQAKALFHRLARPWTEEITAPNERPS